MVPKRRQKGSTPLEKRRNGGIIHLELNTQHAPTWKNHDKPGFDCQKANFRSFQDIDGCEKMYPTYYFLDKDTETPS